MAKKLFIQTNVFKRLYLIFYSVFAIFISAECQEVPVPVKDQVPIFLKSLSFDRNFTSRAGNKIVIAVIYQKMYRSSLNARNDFVESLTQNSKMKINDVPIQCVDIQINSEEDLNRNGIFDNVDIVYLTPLRSISVSSIVKTCTDKKIVTLTGVPDYVKKGVIVGIDLKGENPQILINLQTAKDSGVDFSSPFLKIAKIL